MKNFEKTKAMDIEKMADFLGFFNAEEDICNLSNHKMGVDYCAHHNCHDCAMKYLTQQESEVE